MEAYSDLGSKINAIQVPYFSNNCIFRAISFECVTHNPASVWSVFWQRFKKWERATFSRHSFAKNRAKNNNKNFNETTITLK